jgi:hypothetical protein
MARVWWAWRHRSRAIAVPVPVPVPRPPLADLVLVQAEHVGPDAVIVFDVPLQPGGGDQEVHLNQTANTKTAQKSLTISLQTPLYPVRFARGRSGALGREGAALL